MVFFVNYIKILGKTFYSREFYREVVHKWRGTGFAYLLKLAALIAFLTSILLNALLYHIIKDTVENKDSDYRLRQVIDQIPEMKFKNRKMETAVKQPYYIKLPESSQVIVIIDTTGKVTSLHGTEAAALFSQNEFLVRKDKDAFEVRNYPQAAGSINSSLILSFLKENVFSITMASGVISFFIIAVAVISFAFPSAMLLALAGVYISRAMKFEMSYADSLRTSSVALTPVIIADSLLRPYIPISILVIASLCYIYFAITSSINKNLNILA